MLAEARYFARMMAGCRRFLRTPVARSPRALIARNLVQREENLFELMKGAVFENPRHPLHQLFGRAGCNYGDLKAAVASNGLEETLRDVSVSMSEHLSVSSMHLALRVFESEEHGGRHASGDRRESDVCERAVHRDFGGDGTDRPDEPDSLFPTPAAYREGLPGEL